MRLSITSWDFADRENGREMFVNPFEMVIVLYSIAFIAVCCRRYCCVLQAKTRDYRWRFDNKTLIVVVFALFIMMCSPVNDICCNVLNCIYHTASAYDYDNVYADGYGFRELNFIFEFEI